MTDKNRAGFKVGRRLWEGIEGLLLTRLGGGGVRGNSALTGRPISEQPPRYLGKGDSLGKGTQNVILTFGLQKELSARKLYRECIT